MTVSPSALTRSTSGNTLTFTFNTQNASYGANSVVSLFIPVGWTQPQSSASGSAGYVTTAVQAGSGWCPSAPQIGTISGSSGAGWTIPLTFSCAMNKQFTLTYATVTAPSTAQSYTFTTMSQDGATGTLTAISTQPTVTVVNSTTTGLTSSLNPSRFGDTVTFTATVASTAGTPTGSVTFKDGSSTLGTGTLNGSGVATLRTSALTIGTHSITADYGGSSSFAASSSSSLVQTVGTAGTTMALRSQHNPSVFGQSVTFTVDVDCTGHTPTGTVLFKDGPTSFGSDTDSVGRTRFSASTATLTTGSHTIAAEYGGDGNCAANSISLSQTVSPATTTTALTSSVSAATYGQTVAFTATVTRTSAGSGAPTGSVAFQDGTTTLGSATLVAGSTTAAVATLSTSALTAGNHSIVAVYSNGDGNYATSTSTGVSLTIAPAAAGVSLNSVSLSQTYDGTPRAATATTTPLGLSYSVSYSGANGTIYGPSTTAPTSAGSYSVTATVTNPNYTGGATGAMTISPASPSVVVTSSANPVYEGTSLTFTATVTSTAGTPTGSVTFKDGSATLGTGTLSGLGVATFNTSALTIGAHSITASYSGDINVAATTSSPLSQNILEPTVPDAPSQVRAGPNNGQATVVWTAPAADGGRPVTGYVVTSSAGQTVSVSSGNTWATVPGLTNGAPYSFVVAAVNAVGVGPASAPSNIVRPQGTAAPVSSTTTLSPTATIAVICANAPLATTIIVPVTVTDPMLDVECLVSTSSGVSTAPLPTSVTIQSETTALSVSVQLALGTIISSTSAWTGTIALPRVTENSTNQVKIEIGFGDVPLSLSHPARITFTNRAGSRVGYTRSGVLVEIATQCTANDQTSVENQIGPSGGECKINEGADLVVWTMHFTEFSILGSGGGASVPSAGGGGGGGGSGGGGAPPISSEGAPPTPLARPPAGVPTVETLPVTTAVAGIPAVNAAAGGLLRTIPARPGAVAVLTTAPSSPAYLTMIVPARDVPVIARVQPQSASGLSIAPGAGAEPSRVFTVELFDGQSGRRISKHPTPVTIVVKISAELLTQVGNDPNRLAFIRYDEATGQYVRLPSTYDPATQTLRTETLQTSPFSVVRLPVELADVVVTRPLPLVPINGLPARRNSVPFLVKNLEGWTSGIQIQSLAGSANVVVTYFDVNGQSAGSQTETVAAGSSRTLFDAGLAVPDGFVGSAVVSSDQPIAVIVNELHGEQRHFTGEAGEPSTVTVHRSASYDGVAVPTNVQYLPLVLRENSGWNTELWVQNASRTGRIANVRLEYYQGSSLVKTQALPPIQAGASARVRQIDQPDLGERWVGSVKAIADQPVATVVNEIHERMLMSYSGFAGGVSRLAIPLVMNDNSGWFTGLQVQNVGAAAVPVTLRVAGAAVAEITIEPGASHTWFPIPGTSPGFVGAATVEGPAGSQLVAIVNQVHPSTGQAMAYRGFGGGSSVVSAPLIMTDNQGWFTGLQVQNAGVESTRVTLLVNGAAVETTTLAAGQSRTWFPVPGTGPGFVGSVVVQGDATSQLVGLVNEIQTASDQAGDSALAYEAFN
ncbi:MAG: Ig-like domain repeat protein [Chloroflexi bacterium]|nr:Ig-like domain repeat protein [Chloroflexota bacterium]